MKLLARIVLAVFVVAGLGSSAAVATARTSAAAKTLFDYDRSAPLDAVLGKATTYQGVVRQELSYQATESLRLKAYFVHPAEGGPWPLVIWSPGAGGDRREELSEARELARGGAASLLVDAPPFRPGCRHDILQEYVDYVVSRRRAVDLAATLPDVDARRIAAAGFSYGAEITATLSGVEHRIAAFALKSGRGHHTGFVRIFCTSLGAVELNTTVARLSVVDPVRWVGRETHAAVLVQNGTHDTLTPRADVLALYAAARKPKELRWYPANHGLTAAATAYRAQWLLRHLRSR
jgi:dienelactone hydrolase